MSILKIALLQIAPDKTLEENLEKGIECCKKAKEMGADIALFPEMWSNGYRIYDRPVKEWQAEAILVESDFVNAFGSLAKELNMAIGVTLLEEFEPFPRNSMVLFDRYGVQKLVYAKVHTCDFSVEANLTPGEDFYVTTLDTEAGEVQVEAMICYDREFPESARILMLKGAELILVPYLPELEGSRDTCILQAGEKEGIYLAELDLQQLRKYRETEVHGNAYRHPKKYGKLVETRIEKPFVRTDYRE